MEFKYRTIVNQQQQRVFSLALHILADRSEAEDVTQEAFERLWKNIELVDVDGAKPWLMQVTRNLCIDHLRRRRPFATLDEMQDEAACEREDNSPSGALRQSQLSQWLQKAISALKEPYKSLLVMAELQQKSIKEIAAIMAMNENQVKVYVHRARKDLRHSLQGLEL